MPRATEREQKLVDILFECVCVISDPEYRKTFDAMTNDQRAEWAAKQLRTCGFDTYPCGMSHGVLRDTE